MSYYDPDLFREPDDRGPDSSVGYMVGVLILAYIFFHFYMRWV